MNGRIHPWGMSRCGNRQASADDPSRAEVCILTAHHGNGHMWFFESEAPDFVQELRR